MRWSLLFAYLIIVLGFSGKKFQNTICKNKNIIINEPHHFVDSTSVEKLLITNSINLDSCIIDKLNFDLIENILEDNPFISNAEVYCLFDGTLNINITQRNPIMRIITENNETYYLDESCKLMPISDVYTANVIVLSGNISSTFISTDITKSNFETIDKSYSYTLHGIYKLVAFLNNHELWKYQIEQIYINDDKEIELIPRVGNHIIILGDLNNYEYKMGKLEALYKKGFALTDWNIYSSINLKYSNQVICKKR